MESSQHKRKNYLIKKPFQLKYALSMILLIALVMGATGLGVYYGMWSSIAANFSSFEVSRNLETAKRITDYEGARFNKGDYRLEKIFREAELLSQNQREALRNALTTVNRSLLPKLALLAASIFILGVFISHKIAGPMYRIEKSARAIRDGDLSVNFNVRKNDEMRQTASALEEMVDSLQEDIKNVKTASSLLAAKVDLIKPKISDDDYRHLKDAADRINLILARYKT